MRVPGHRTFSRIALVLLLTLLVWLLLGPGPAFIFLCLGIAVVALWDTRKDGGWHR